MVSSENVGCFLRLLKQPLPGLWAPVITVLLAIVATVLSARHSNEKSSYWEKFRFCLIPIAQCKGVQIQESKKNFACGIRNKAQRIRNPSQIGIRNPESTNYLESVIHHVESGCLGFPYIEREIQCTLSFFFLFGNNLNSPAQTHLHRSSYSQQLRCCILFLVPPWPPATGSSLPYLLE